MVTLLHVFAFAELEEDYEEDGEWEVEGFRWVARGAMWLCMLMTIQKIRKERILKPRHPSTNRAQKQRHNTHKNV